LGDRREVNGNIIWTFRIYYNPLIDLIFFGVFLMALGGGFSAFGGRKVSITASEPAPLAPITLEPAE
jgi:cytochrome c biogenesis factor